MPDRIVPAVWPAGLPPEGGGPVPAVVCTGMEEPGAVMGNAAMAPGRGRMLDTWQWWRGRKGGRWKNNTGSSWGWGWGWGRLHALLDYGAECAGEEVHGG